MVKKPKKSFSFSAEDDYLQVSFYLFEANFDGADDDGGKEGWKVVNLNFDATDGTLIRSQGKLLWSGKHDEPDADEYDDDDDDDDAADAGLERNAKTASISPGSDFLWHNGNYQARYTKG